MIGIIVTGVMTVFAVIYVIIDGTIFERDEPITKKEEVNNDVGYECP